MRRKWYITGACLLLLLGVERLYYFQNGGFRSSKLISDLPSECNPPPEGIKELLDQPFHFLGRGGTSFAFLGEDGKTVLKLFKHQHLFPKNPLFRLKLPGISDRFRIDRIVATQKKKAHKHHSFFLKSCSLAYTALQEETGLLYLSLRPNTSFDQSIKLIDRWGFVHRVNLSQTEFALQKKADLFLPHLEALLKTGKQEECKLALDSLLNQIARRCHQGIGDRDSNLLINFGFVEGAAVEFDLGSYFVNRALKNPAMQKRELFISTYDLQKWLEKHSPDLLDYLLKRIQNGI